jgi:ubiquinone/menaquinone biosynthesis C-methylase UbiE
MAALSNKSGTDKPQGDYARKLELFEILRGPLVREAIEWLELPQATHGLDAGCGAGLHLEPLLMAISPEGRVTGLDNSSGLIKHARAKIEDKGLSDAIELKQADLWNLPFERQEFDWVWSVDCAGYMPGDKPALLNELSRILKPGGLIVLMAYSSQQLLPGYPGLEARLNATSAGQAPFIPESAPNHHFLRLPDLLSQSGFKNNKSKTFLAEFHAPLNSSIKEALLELMDMRWGAARNELTQKDWDLFLRLARSGSPECILDQPGYYGFFTYTMFTSRKLA